MRKLQHDQTNSTNYNKPYVSKLAKRLNFGINDVLSRTALNEDQLPIHYCDPTVYPDFIALNTQPGTFSKTPATAVAFYTYDESFDGKGSLYSAIYNCDADQLEFFKERYAGVKFFIAPDHSIFDDSWRFENEYRLFKTRIEMAWFVLELNAIAIPSAVYVSPDKQPLYMSGFESCTVMCFSTKGHVRRAAERRRVRETVKYAVDNLPLRTILVYSACGKDKTSLRLFKYAQEKGVDVRIIDNVLRRRNQEKLAQKEAL